MNARAGSLPLRVAWEETADAVLRAIEEEGLLRPLLVLDAQVFEDEPTQDIINRLEHVDYVTCTGYVLPVSLDEVKDGAVLYRANGCDGLLAVGGGSTLDLARLIGLVVCNDRTWSDFFYDPRAGERIPPLIAVPTTFGGAERGRDAFAIDFSDPVVRDIARDAFVPRYLMYDARYIATLPKDVVVAGLCACALHLVELYLKGEDVEELCGRLGVLARETLDENEDVYSDLQRFSFDLGRILRGTGHGFLSGLSIAVSAYTEVPCNWVKAAFFAAYLRYEFDHTELDIVARLFGWPEGSALLEGIRRAVRGSGLLDRLRAAAPLLETYEREIAGRTALSAEGDEDAKGISPQEVRGLMREILDY